VEVGEQRGEKGGRLRCGSDKRCKIFLRVRGQLRTAKVRTRGGRGGGDEGGGGGYNCIAFSLSRLGVGWISRPHPPKEKKRWGLCCFQKKGRGGKQ